MKNLLLGILSIGILILLYMNKQHRSKIVVMDKIKKTIFNMWEKVSNTNNIQEVYSIILDVAVEIIPCALKGSILIIEGDELFHIRAVKGFDEDLKNFTLKREEIFLYSINNFKETAIIRNPIKLDENIVSEEKINELREMRALNIYCTISSPIYIDNKLIGLLNVDCIDENKEFNNEDLLLMNHIKNELQLALKNSIIQNKLSIMANVDELTKLYNRRYFSILFNKEIKRIYNSNSTSCLALIDLDDFKSINDNYGHVEGDKVLKQFANKITGISNEKSICGRMSGDEFVILFVDTSLKVAEDKMEELTQSVKTIIIGKNKFSFSYGLCEISNLNPINADEILATADKKMYNDKKTKLCTQRKRGNI